MRRFTKTRARRAALALAAGGAALTLGLASPASAETARSITGGYITSIDGTLIHCGYDVNGLNYGCVFTFANGVQFVQNADGTSYVYGSAQ